MFLKRIFLYLKFVLYIAGGQIVQWISHFFKKNKRLWVFGAMLGRAYGGNSRYLFEYIAENEKLIRPIWLTKNKKICRLIRGKGLECYMFYSLRGMMAIMSAGVVFITHGVLFGDVPYCCVTKNTLLVQLWHGSPIKRLGRDDPLYCDKRSLYKTVKKIFSRFFTFINYPLNPNIFISTSPEVQRIFQRAFNLDVESLPITGNPRDDIFYDLNRTKLKKSDVKKVIYLPTFRGQYGSYFDPFTGIGFDFEKFDKRLRDSSVELYVKLHQYNVLPSDVLKKIKKCSNVGIHSGLDVYEDICGYDCLITDYSSIYFDYMHLDRPILFFPFDYDSYLVNDREFYYEYNDITPGEKFYSWEALVDKLCDFESIASDNKYIVKRNFINKRFHSYLDGNNSKRVFNHVLKNLQNIDLDL